jgi:hypothetical protein
MVTSASLLYVNEFVRERQDVGVLLLTHVSQEVQESLLQVSCLGVPQLIGQRADSKVHPPFKTFNAALAY